MIKIQIAMDNATKEEINKLYSMISALGGKKPKNIESIKNITIKENTFRQMPLNLFDVDNSSVTKVLK